MAGERTAVLVSHRLGFARLCDRVLVLDGGELADQGSHDPWVAAGGVTPACGRCRPVGIGSGRCNFLFARATASLPLVPCAPD